MGICIQGCCNRNEHTQIWFIFLLILWLTQVQLMVEGRAISKLVDVPQKDGEERVVMARAPMGSRPPRCERKCRSCGDCEAVQVPVIPNLMRSQQYFFAAYSRGDDISNYKPMCWKCKCGDFIFNP